MQQKKLLLIDDEPAIQTLVRLVMEADGWQVLVAGEGARGLDLAREQKPDVILLDVALPDVSGLEICRQLKADSTTSSVPIAMLTAMAQETDRRAAMALGADDYVTKPWRPAALIARVSSLMERRGRRPEAIAPEGQ